VRPAGRTPFFGKVSHGKQSEHAMSASPPPPDDDTPPQDDAPLGAPQQVQMDFSPRNIVRIVTVNVLVLAELVLALYMAAQNPEEFQPVFLKVFFSLLVPTLILASIAKRLMKRLIRPKAEQ
jgi:hypothetical protein